MFGFHDKGMDSIENFVVLITKGYIWKAKFELSMLVLTSWKKYLKVKLEDLKSSYAYLHEMHKFEQWSNVFALL